MDSEKAGKEEHEDAWPAGIAVPFMLFMSFMFVSTAEDAATYMFPSSELIYGSIR